MLQERKPLTQPALRCWNFKYQEQRETSVSFLHNMRSRLQLLGVAIGDGGDSSSSGVKPPWNLDAKVFACIKIDTSAGQAGQNE